MSNKNHVISNSQHPHHSPQSSLQHSQLSPQSSPLQSRDSQVWDPGARILIYSDNNNNNNSNNNNAKDKISKNKFYNTRASPNKSQDSGFSDSGESESSNHTAENKGITLKQISVLLLLHAGLKLLTNNIFMTTTLISKFAIISGSQGHVTKVYFYSNNAESHYQSPSSLPVYSSVTQIQTGNRIHQNNFHTHSVSVPDVVQLSKLPLNNHRKSNKSKSLSDKYKSFSSPIIHVVFCLQMN